MRSAQTHNIEIMKAAKTMRKQTYQTNAQYHCERALAAAKAAAMHTGREDPGDGDPGDEATEGLYRLGLFVAHDQRECSTTVMVPARNLEFSRPVKGVPLHTGSSSRRFPGRPYVMMLTTHSPVGWALPLRLGTGTPYESRPSLFDDGYGPDHMTHPMAASHREILFGLLFYLELAIARLIADHDFARHPGGEDPDAELHPEAMLAAVRTMLRATKADILAHEVMES
ncbi:MAG: hypothetical protein ABI548_03915 [Polyangiaceae bacterium]